MEGNSQDLGESSMENQKIFEAVKRRKLKSAPDPDSSEAVEVVEDRAKQSMTHKLEKKSGSDCGSNSFGSEITPQEFAFSIEHVLEEILGSLDLSTLLACRLVSHKWKLASTCMILEHLCPRIYFKYSPTDQVYYARKRTAWNADPDADAVAKPTLEELTCFLKESYSPAGPFQMKEFPCNKFIFLEGSLSSLQLQNFLNTFGEHLFSLFFNFLHSLEGRSEAKLLKQMKYLLNTQASNLKSLNLFSNTKLAIADDSDDAVLNSNDSCLSPPFQNFQNDHSHEANEIQREAKSALLKLDYRGCQRKILDYIISISPNLRDISLFCIDYHLLSSPLNRLHFLKKFVFFSSEDAPFDFENFKLIKAALSVSNEERETKCLPLIKFKELYMDFIGIRTTLLSNPDIRSCFVRVINKILELSSDSLESISLVNQNEGTLQGIKWPRVLPEVRELDLRFDVGLESGLELFPSNCNFKIQKTFPKLEQLIFDEINEYDGNIPVSSSVEFLRNCNFGPAPSVKFVEVPLYLDGVPSDLDVAEEVKRIRSDVTDSLVRLFPSAELTHQTPKFGPC